MDFISILFYILGKCLVKINFLSNILFTNKCSYDIIVTEKLQINKIVQNKNLSKKIYDVSWYELIRQLEYKSKWKNKKFYQISTYSPSSQICSRCGYQSKRMKDLSIRKWECKSCTNINQRDINASVNIMFEGLKLYVKKGINELQAN